MIDIVSAVIEMFKFKKTWSKTIRVGGSQGADTCVGRTVTVRHLRRCLLLAPILVASVSAGTLPAAKCCGPRWLIDVESGTDSGLGYKLPHLAFGISTERPFGHTFELQAGLLYSPDRKYVTNDGNSLNARVKGIYWISPRMGLTGALRHSNLWTSQFNKAGWGVSAGIAIRDRFGGFPGRVYIDYLFPFGCQWGPNCPIQSNRIQGPEIYWENRLYPHIRFGAKLGFYHVLNQSNNLRPDIPRTGEWTGDAHVVIRYEFSRGSLDIYY